MNYVDKIEQALRDMGAERILPAASPVLRHSFFPIWPASATSKDRPPMHHGDEGGLARHTWQVVERLCHMLNGFGIDPAIPALGAIWHDAGKLQVYVRNPDGGFSRSKSHRLHHITLGLTWWGEVGRAALASCQLNGRDIDAFRRVTLMISSHHGFREWGSIDAPATTEAVLLHHADIQSLLLEGGSNPYLREH